MVLPMVGELLLTIYLSILLNKNQWQDLIWYDKRYVVTNGWGSYYQSYTSLYYLANQWYNFILYDKRPVVTNGWWVTINDIPLDIT
jgi:hypothetical protein